MWTIAFCVIIGLIYGNFAEWFLHKHLLHRFGKNKNSMWSFHWKDHHRYARQNEFFDFDYFKPVSWNTRGKELLGLVGLILLHAPLLLYLPGLAIGAYLHMALYYFLHKKSHLEPEWAKKYLRWHWDHHMGQNQDANWCVTYPLADYVLGTRERY
jgi:hypothetical protein